MAIDSIKQGSYKPGWDSYSGQDGKYLDTFGGVSIINDMQVTVYLTDTSEEVTSFYTGLIGNTAPVIFKEVNYSYNELFQFRNEFKALLAPQMSSYLAKYYESDLIGRIYNAYGCGFDFLNNSIWIGLYSNIPLNQEIVKSTEKERANASTPPPFMFALKDYSIPYHDITTPELPFSAEYRRFTPPYDYWNLGG
jgi:hypothetical protein